MLDTIFGLPIHPLIVHATVVLVPLAAIAVLLTAYWSRFRYWIGPGTVVLTLLAVVLDPLTTQSGEALEHHLHRSELIERHSELADGLLPWLIALAVAAVALYLWRPGVRRLLGDRTFPRWLIAGVITIATIAALGALIQVVLIGHSGAVAAWSNVG
jgi:hypothetical protein